jgi:hypothetical protein
MRKTIDISFNLRCTGAGAGAGAGIRNFFKITDTSAAMYNKYLYKNKKYQNKHLQENTVRSLIYIMENML